MAVLNYKVVQTPQSRQDDKLQEREAREQQLRASKQSTVNNAMLTKIPSAQPQGQMAQPQNQKGWGGTN